MIFLIEAVIGCILFTVGVAVAMKNPLAGIHDYPPKIIQRVTTVIELLPGRNKIEFSGLYTDKIWITPNWWTV